MSKLMNSTTSMRGCLSAYNKNIKKTTLIDITGHVFTTGEHSLTVLGYLQRDEYGERDSKILLVNAMCQCGNIIEVRASNLKSGNTTKCKLCNQHGHRGSSKESTSPTYYSWRCMKDRCTNPNTSNYKWYGAMGVSVCPQWLNSFKTFLADMGERPEGTTLDRINPFGDYEPGNVRWADKHTQANNKRAHWSLPSLG